MKSNLCNFFHIFFLIILQSLGRPLHALSGNNGPNSASIAHMPNTSNSVTLSQINGTTNKL